MFSPLLDNEAFTGLEVCGIVAGFILGSEKGNPFFKELLDCYNGQHYIIGSGVYNMFLIPDILTKMLRKYGMTNENKIQNLGRITVYPVEYFCPYIPHIKEHNFFTEDTMAIHHYTGTWTKITNEREARYYQHLAAYRKKFGKTLGTVFALLQHTGLSKTIGIVWSKLTRKFRRLMYVLKSRYQSLI